MIARIFHGDGESHDWDLPPAPPWRQFNGAPIVPPPHETDWRHIIPMIWNAHAHIGLKAREVEARQRRDHASSAAADHRPTGYWQVHACICGGPGAEVVSRPTLADHQPYHVAGRLVPL